MDEKTICLRDGSSVEVRPARMSDGSGLFQMERAIIERGFGVVKDLDDLGTLEEYENRLKQRLEATPHNACYAVAERRGVIVGDCQIERLTPARVRHVATVSVAVHPSHQSVGIGRGLMDYVLAWARSAQNPPLARIELGVRSDNYPAQRLYSALGFRRECVRRRFIRNPDGSELDDYIMTCFIAEAQ
jgi:ribosomal protein S18 acetylase RimI-like enzyme